jgi:hypothetical protein
MATDADIVPQAVTDFVFDLYDSVTGSQLTEEQSQFYNSVFRDLSSKVIPFLLDKRVVENFLLTFLPFFISFLSHCSTLLRLRGQLRLRLPVNAMVILSSLLYTVN